MSHLQNLFFDLEPWQFSCFDYEVVNEFREVRYQELKVFIFIPNWPTSAPAVYARLLCTDRIWRTFEATVTSAYALAVAAQLSCDVSDVAGAVFRLNPKVFPVEMVECRLMIERSPHLEKHLRLIAKKEKVD